MTLEQQVASLVTATTSLTSIVNSELNNVRQENTNFKNGIVDSQGQGVFDDVKVGRGGGNISSNTIIGKDSLQLNTTGRRNSAFGNFALNQNTVGENNSAFGSGSLSFNTTGLYNSAFGISSLYQNTTGSYNSAFGSGSLSINTTSSYNSAFGVNSLNKSTGSANSAFGGSSLTNNTTGNGNSALGNNSLVANTTGDFNTALGGNSLTTLVSFSNSTGVGAYTEVSGSNQVQLGDSSTTTYVYGTVQNRSDLRDKTDIRNTILGLDFIKSLRPVDYRWDMREDYKPTMPKALGMEATDEQKAAYQSEVKIWLEACKLKNIVHNGTKKRNRFHHGLIAQEVKAVLTQKGIDFGGYQDHSISGGDDVLSLGYDQFIAPLIKAVQELSAQNEALVARISVLESNLK